MRKPKDIQTNKIKSYIQQINKIYRPKAQSMNLKIHDGDLLLDTKSCQEYDKSVISTMTLVGFTNGWICNNQQKKFRPKTINENTKNHVICH